MSDFGRPELEAVGQKLVKSCDAETAEDRTGLRTAFFTGHQDFRTGLAFREGKDAMFFDDEGLTQRDHEQDAQDTADKADEGDGQHAGGFDLAFLGPQEQGGEGEDGTGSQGLTGGTDGLDHVVFENGVFSQDEPDDTHREDGGGDGRGNGHTDAESEVGIGGAEDDGQQDAEDDGGHGDLGDDFVSRNERLVGSPFVFRHDVSSFLYFSLAMVWAMYPYFARRSRTSTTSL